MFMAILLWNASHGSSGKAWANGFDLLADPARRKKTKAGRDPQRLQAAFG
jgi:hypothetical protein